LVSVVRVYVGQREVFAKGPKSINWKHNFKILMDSVEDYTRQWAKREKEDLDTLSILRSRNTMFIIIIFLLNSRVS
jgi:hypothetical protein